MSQAQVTSYFSKGKKRAKGKILTDSVNKQGLLNLKAKCLNLPSIRSPSETTVSEQNKPAAFKTTEGSLVSNIIQIEKPCDSPEKVSVTNVAETNVLLPSTPTNIETTPHTPKRVLSDPKEETVSWKKRKCDTRTSHKKDITPTKVEKVESHSSVRKKLILPEDISKKIENSTQVSKKPETKFGSLVRVVNTSRGGIKEEEKPHISPAVSPLKASLLLPLPPAYKLLLEKFRCTDLVVSMIYNRKEVCTFGKLKDGVQNMTKRQFTMTHLGQMKTVSPSLYNITVEKTASTIIHRNPRTPQFQLVITPNLKDVKQKIKELSPGKLQQSSSPLKKSCPSPSFVSMTPACLVERKGLFTYGLVNIAKLHHQDFLSKLDPPVRVPKDKLTQWHPKFDLSKIPDVEAAPLPELPDQQKVNSAKDVLNKMAEKHLESVKRALEFVASKTSQPEKVQASTVENKGTKINKWLKGIDAGLLQRIRQKEATNNAESMMATPEEKKRKKMLERVPQLVSSIRQHFLVERKAAITLEEVTKKVSESCRGFLSLVDAEEHIKFMVEIFPKWLQIIEIRKRHFLKIDKNVDITVLLQSMPKH